jgi:phospholipid/cholesterol/gamma-HCH transport system permease protein
VAQASETESVAEPDESLIGRLLAPLTDALDNLGRLLILTGQSLAWLIRPPYRFSQLLAAMDFIGVQSIFIVALTGVFSGMVLALQLTYSLKLYGAEGLVGRLVALSLLREMAPVFASLMITARAGSAMAAELGNMRVTEQIDAIKTMAVSPVQYLLSPRLLAATLVSPMLCVLFSGVGMCGAYLVAVKWLGVDLGTFLARIEDGVGPQDYYMGLVKSAVFGFLICAISCNQGFHAAGGAKGVGEATTRAVVQSAVAILIANYLLTSLMTEM